MYSFPAEVDSAPTTATMGAPGLRNTWHANSAKVANAAGG